MLTSCGLYHKNSNVSKKIVLNLTNFSKITTLYDDTEICQENRAKIHSDTE